MATKRVLIITYYWPPSGGSGVQRWLKTTKYLRDYGWEPIIFKPIDGEYPELDHSLLKDVPKDITIIESKIWEPYKLYKSITGRKKSEKVQVGFLNEDKKPGVRDKISKWIRGNFFIPDARKYWVKPAYRKISEWLKDNHVDAIVSTGPPHTTHLIAMKIKKKFGVPWLADFRDPWTGIDFYDQLMLTSWADKKHRSLEKQVLINANSVVTVSTNCKIDLEKIVNRKINVVNNGFDEDDFNNLPTINYDSFIITHLGSMNGDRNPKILWEAIAELIQDDELFKMNLKIRFIGKTDRSIFETCKKLGIYSFIDNLNYMPHIEAVKKTSESSVLLLPLNDTPNVKGIAPGKLYEYLALDRSILCIGPTDGDAAAIICETNSGYVVDFKDKKTMKEVLQKLFELYTSKSVNENSEIKKYSRKILTGKIAELLNTISNKENFS
jgi:glycosyltransferase involved in cell wall biosynthesis